jgi:hypothetical protein
MGALRLCGDLVMAVSMNEHKVVPLVILMVSIHMVDFQYVLVSKEKLAVATFAFLLLEQSGSSW